MKGHIYLSLICVRPSYVRAEQLKPCDAVAEGAYVVSVLRPQAFIFSRRSLQ